MNLIEKSVLDHYYPHLKVDKLSSPISIGGVGDGTIYGTSTVTVPVNLRDLNGGGLQFSAKCHVVDQLECKFLLGLPFLQPNHLNIL